MSDRAPHHDVDAFHGDAAARRRIAVDAQQSAVARGASRLARVASHVDEARHHVLGHADPGVAMDEHGSELVHAGAVIADRSVDLDGDRSVQAGGNGVPAGRSVDDPVPLVGIGMEAVERRVQLSERR